MILLLLLLLLSACMGTVLRVCLLHLLNTIGFAYSEVNEVNQRNRLEVFSMAKCCCSDTLGDSAFSSGYDVCKCIRQCSAERENHRYVVVCTVFSSDYRVRKNIQVALYSELLKVPLRLGGKVPLCKRPTLSY